MDPARFDRLSRSVATGSSRRILFKTFVGGVVGAALGLLGPRDAGAACQKVNQRCNAANPCCKGGRCAGGRCQCKEGQGWQACNGPGSRCVNTNASEKHCGGCGNTCGGTCSAGICQSSGCTSDGECNDGDQCTVGSCDNGQRRHVQATCQVRLLVVLPSDWFGSATHEQLGSPSRNAIAASASNARDRIKSFYASELGLDLRFNDVHVLSAPNDTLWFTTRTDGFARESEDNLIIDYISGRGGTHRVSAAAICDDPNRETINLDRLGDYLWEAGFGGFYPDGWINLVIFGSTWRGGFAGALVPPPVIQLPDAAPDAGPRRGTTAICGQWVLDVVLTGQNSPSCQGQQGNDCNEFWPCPANVGWGTLMHELGHSLGVAHPCDGWQAEHWGFSQATCDALIMQSHWNYPNTGFHQKEVAILSRNPALQR